MFDWGKIYILIYEKMSVQFYASAASICKWIFERPARFICRNNHW